MQLPNETSKLQLLNKNLSIKKMPPTHSLFHRRNGLIALPLLVGFYCYLCWRPGTLVESWLGIYWPAASQGLDNLRQWLLLPKIPVISAVLPDFCWAFALTASLARLGHRKPWWALGLALGTELAQWPGWLPGTFDWLDMAAISLAVPAAHFLSNSAVEQNHDPMENPGLIGR